MKCLQNNTIPRDAVYLWDCKLLPAIVLLMTIEWLYWILNTWTNTRTNKRTNKRTNERTNERTNTRTHAHTHARTYTSSCWVQKSSRRIDNLPDSPHTARRSRFLTGEYVMAVRSSIPHSRKSNWNWRLYSSGDLCGAKHKHEENDKRNGTLLSNINFRYSQMWFLWLLSALC